MSRTPLLLVLVTVSLLAGAARYGARPSANADREDRFRTDRQSAVTLPLPPEDDAFTFAVYGDRTGGPASGIAILEQAVADTNVIGPDLVMTVGDLIQGYNQTPAWMAQMVQFRAVMSALSMPWFPVAGNHDVYWRGDGKPEGEHEANYERHFGPLWYAFEHKDSWFVVLYTDEGNPETGAKAFRDPAAQRMSDAQLTWLRGTLENARGAENVFVFLHHPRWIGGGYGDDWERVHAELAAAGNVRAVFAGHIHHMRYDGERDGIEYFTLATVGGHEVGDVARAGFLHEFHLVTVRGQRISVAAMPVGAVLDPRTITAELSAAVRTLDAKARPRPVQDVRFDPATDVALDLPVEVTNPTSFPMKIACWLEADDHRWRLGGAHVHQEVGPRETARWTFRVHRAAGTLDTDFGLPRLGWQIDHLGTDTRIQLPRREQDLELHLDRFPADTGGERVDGVLALDGDDALRIPSTQLLLPDGPFTLETWMRADRFGERTGLITKTESSEFGIFVSGGVPAFMVHDGSRYAEAEADRAVLEPGRWHHVAGVFTGEAVELYVDGVRLASTPASGPRSRNELPLLVGADVDGSGQLTSGFEGQLDEVRLSIGARYTDDGFEPERTLATDATSLLHLRMDGHLGPWWRNAVDAGPHPTSIGDPELRRDER